ncbi:MULTISPECIES: hypothetical protein [Janthinobacterium]|uniref:GIY-YIG nuclease family protein n=1 Tax=Janthinobacterium kumbetense TaxID=2950280 RepID=A0ABT0WKC1_9BURK|nr:MULTISPECIES: hypothetical protein [Janthinobacterium]MCM2564504.1 hypothetical protein [Janthinobacterium kumbetense]MDO8065238.1 hypothetical protein [Janthinobacterium sp. SUN206]MDO8071594.1 hypothetical protein [Janthinobacterium sp. SUN176]
MNKDTPFYFSCPDSVEIQVKVDWSLPVTHDVLFHGLVEEDATAYFYAIIAIHEKEWWPYYIGKVFSQSTSQRHRAADHIARIARLREEYPEKTFHISLGTPILKDMHEVPDSETVDDIEGLLIISNWSEKMINKRKVDRFICTRQISLENTGFSEHLYKRAAYGLFWAGE